MTTKDEFEVLELPPGAEKVPTLYMAIIIILGISVILTLGAALYLAIDGKSVPDWVVAVVSAIVGGLLGLFCPREPLPSSSSRRRRRGPRTEHPTTRDSVPLCWGQSIGGSECNRYTSSGRTHGPSHWGQPPFRDLPG